MWRPLIADARCHDETVPFPTAAISLSDPFEAFLATGIHVSTDENHIVQSWHNAPSSSSTTTQRAISAVGSEETGLLKESPTSVSPMTRMRKRPRIPPMLLLPYPFTYVSAFVAKAGSR